MRLADLRLQVGGTLNPRRHIYIERPEDVQVRDLLLRGEYVNVLSARQMGKSSLMVRVMGILQAQGIRTATVDLAAEVGAPATPDSFYQTLLTRIADGLNLELDVAAWWRERPNDTVNRHIFTFFSAEVLEQITSPVVIFLDEIDSTLRLPYTDDLFTTIRGMYNQRATTEIYQRLTFCLLGVATPNELIKDRRTTPYNVGSTIELRDFEMSRDDLTSLTAHLDRDPHRARQLLRRILHWTGGQPYLTARLCELTDAVGERDIDRLVDATFSSLDQLGGDPHVQTILAFLDTRVADGVAAFQLYKRVLQGRPEPDQQTPTHAALKLCGLVKRDHAGRLKIRNPIYQRLFGQRWVAARTPTFSATTYRTAALTAFTFLFLSVLSAGGYYVLAVRPSQQAGTELLALGAKVKVGRTASGLQVELPDNTSQPDFARAVTALIRLGTVTSLTTKSSQISDVEPLRGLTKLQWLFLPRTQVSNVEPLRGLAALQVLSLSGTKVSNVAPLAGLTNLKGVDLSRTQVSNVEPLAGLTALEDLDLSGTQVSNVEPLRGLTELQWLFLSGTQVSNVAPLAGLTKLQWLFLSGTQVSNVAPLAGLTGLQNLNLASTPVSNVSALSALGNLRVLDLTGSRVPTDQATRLQWPFRHNKDIIGPRSPTEPSVDEMGRNAPPMFTSVGRNGVNAPGDVFIIQSLLNDRLREPHAPIPINGAADVGTTLAIEFYQASIRLPPSGRVDPDSPAVPTTPLVEWNPPQVTGHFGEVPAEVADAAIASRKKWTVPASVTIAQWAVESVWGIAMPPGSNNPFGIKAVGDQPAVESPTREVIKGENVTFTARFRAFDSLTQAFDEHGRLLATVPVYKDAMKQVDNPEAFADALTGVYATDPYYGSTLKWVIENCDLSQYDR